MQRSAMLAIAVCVLALASLCTTASARAQPDEPLTVDLAAGRQLLHGSKKPKCYFKPVPKDYYDEYEPEPENGYKCYPVYKKGYYSGRKTLTGYKCCPYKVTKAPTKYPTKAPTKYYEPTPAPTKYYYPTKAPTKYYEPTPAPTKYPTKAPTKYYEPTPAPTKYPTKAPTKYYEPTPAPAKHYYPTKAPTKYYEPTPAPTKYYYPTKAPTKYSYPTKAPTNYYYPTKAPTKYYKPTKPVCYYKKVYGHFKKCCYDHTKKHKKNHKYRCFQSSFKGYKGLYCYKL